MANTHFNTYGTMRNGYISYFTLNRVIVPAEGFCVYIRCVSPQFLTALSAINKNNNTCSQYTLIWFSFEYWRGFTSVIVVVVALLSVLNKHLVCKQGALVHFRVPGFSIWKTLRQFDSAEFSANNAPSARTTDMSEVRLINFDIWHFENRMKSRARHAIG